MIATARQRSERSARRLRRSRASAWASSTSSKRSSATIPSPLARTADLVAERRLERVGGVAQAAASLRIEPPPASASLFGWPASRTLFSVSRTDQPPRDGVAGEAAADVVAAGAEQGPAVALAELAGLEQLQRLVGKLEQADQVGDGGAAAADAARQLLFGQPQLLDQGRAGLRLLDRVEVLADHVLDQRRLQPLGLGLVADDRRHLLEARLLRGAPAALAGDQLVAAVGEGADQQRLDDAAGLDRGGEGGEGLGVELGPRLARGWA